MTDSIENTALNLKFLIRSANRTDIAALQSIESSAAALFVNTVYSELAQSVPISNSTYLEQFDKAHSIFIADLLGGNTESQVCPIGFAFSAPLGLGLHLHELSVHADYQRRGVGRALLKWTVRQAKNMGLPFVSLTTYRDIAWNAPFYRDVGFDILPEAELTPPLRDILASEISAGACAQTRCAMRLILN